MDVEYLNISTLSSLLGESTTTEKSNSDIFNDTIQTIHKVISTKDMPQLCFALLLTYLWIIYITFYNHRIIGYLVTKFMNKLFFKTAYFKIGSITINPLAGKIMFRDLVYINYDYSCRVQDGYVIFRWWSRYVPKDISDARTDLSHSETRLSIMLNSFELHIYNRSDLYAEVEKAFGLKSSILIPTQTMSAEELAKIKEQALNLENQKMNLKKKRPEAMNARTWRDLIPVIKLDISSGRFSFGNRLTPTTLSICLEEARCVYSTRPAVNPLDHFMHFVKAKVENAKVLLAPSPKYIGMTDEPPRFMGEGFVVMMSNFLDLYFYMDEAGVVPEEPVLVTLANGDVVEAAPPVWGIDIKCGKGNSNISYGPWADRQRDHLYKFFFPQDYKDLEPTPAPKPGERRIVHSFDVKWSTLTHATIDILFSKEKETNAVHINIGPGSYMEAVLPWITLQDGFATKITGQFLHVDATTSLQYRSLAEFESLHYNIKIQYPMKWNEHQDWSINLIGYKATANIVFWHKEFFQYLIEDWATKTQPDIFNFVPYTCKFSVLLKEFEIITISNEYNWIDCSSTNQENNHLAFCGDLFDLSFALPFDDYLPNTVPLKFWIHGEGLDLSLYLPEISTSRPIIHAIDENATILTREGQIKKKSEIHGGKWRRVCLKKSGWVDCWSVPILAISIQYIYHPMPPLGPDPQADITTPEKEEILLSPMRIPKSKKSTTYTWNTTNGQQHFNPTTLESDEVTVEIEIGSSMLFAYGSILKNFYYLKENIFGEDQMFTDMEESNAKSTSHKTASAAASAVKSTTVKDDINKSISEAASSIEAEEKQTKSFDPRLYRPLDVTVILTIHDIQAHLMKNCNSNDPPCPIVLIERLGFEMNKRFFETKLQVLVSPAFLISPDNYPRPSKEKHLKQGHLLLSALQIRGHAMFSNENRCLDEDTLEYAWLLEIQLGKLSGKLTLPQLTHVVMGLESMAYLALDSENDLKSPKSILYCHHGMASNVCPQTKEDVKYRCPSSEDIKYRMIRVAIDAIDIYIVENGCALHNWISPIRFSTCNLHGQQVKSGITALIPNVLIRHFVATGAHLNHNNGNSHSNTNTTGSGRSSKLQSSQNSKTVDDKKDDLNPLMKRGDEASIKAKKENEYGLYRRGSRDKDEISTTYGSMRRSKDENHFKRDEIYSSIHSHKTRDSESYHEPWLEVGCVAFGPVIIEAATALPIPEHCLHLVQNNYLKLHDERTKRLMFLWTTSDVKCGCLGGCLFFGSNRNGPKFFKPSPQDLQDGINIARYHIIGGNKEFGFGQSLVHDNQLVFHTPPYSLQTISLQECYEYIGKNTCRTSRQTLDSKSPLPQKHDNFHSSHKSDVSPNNTFVRDKSGRSTLERVKEKESNSPITAERRGRRFSYTNSKQVHDVPYRLLDSSPKTQQQKQSESRQSHSRADFECRISQKDDDSDLLSRSAPQSSHPMQSDSEHSLSPKFSDDVTLRDVQRTISLTSENPSEAFFSADEEIHASRSSSLKTTDVSLPLGCPKKRFASDLSIVGPLDASGKLSSHRSDYEIHTPEHRLPTRPQSTAELNDERRLHNLATPLRKFNNISPRPEFRHFKPVYDINPDSSESHSLSSSSFISALSSQEDMTLVNLHMQANRPIVDSPLLMASYLTHLAQVRCSNWSHCSLPTGSDSFSMPLFQKNDDGGLVYIGSKLVPHFDNYSHWREIKIIPRFDGTTATASSGNQNIPSSSAPPKSHPWDPMVVVRGSNEEKSNEKEGKKDQEFLGTFHGEMPASRTSLVVRFKGQIDVMLTPLLLESSQRMIEALIPTLSSFHPLTVVNHLHNSCVNKVEAMNILKRDQSRSYWSQIHSNSKRSTTERNLQAGMPVMTDVYEEIYTQPTVRAGVFKKGGLISNTRALLAHLSSTNRTESGPLEAILIETSENQLEELVLTLDIGKAHAQLRRLKNEGYSQESQTIITAIPSHRSRAMFDCTKFPEESSDINGLGFIMFECGLEGISIKIVKRSQFEKSDNAEDTLKNVAEKTKAADSTSHTAMNFVQLLNEAGSMKAAEAIATTVRQIAMKKPTTPKPNASSKLKQTEKDPEKGKMEKEPPIILEDETNSEPQATKLNPTPINMPKDQTNDNGKISSCIIDLKTTWFNFAAPPRAPITKKIDYSRLDWNLLSTAAPSITAWMNPANRLAIKVVSMMRMLYQRETAVVTSLMCEALEQQSNYRLPKSRYPLKFTPMAKTLQDDCSCKLFTILQQYVTTLGVDKIEGNLKQQFVPPLSTLRQGVIVLSRQWKSILYNPMLFEHQYKGKLKRPSMNPTFSVPTIDDDDDNDDDNQELPVTIDHLMTVDEENESALLLKQRPLTQHVINIPEDNSTLHIAKLTESVNSSPSTINSSKKKKTLYKNVPPPSSRSSIQMFPMMSGLGLVDKQDPHIEYGALKSGSIGSMCSSTDSNEKIPPPRPPPPNVSYRESSNVKDDLYSWMAKQQTSSTKHDEHKADKGDMRTSPNKANIHAFNAQDSGRLLDAHLIFEPLLTCLDVMPTKCYDNNQDATSLENLGTNLSLVCLFDTFRIDIVVSEAGDKKPKTKISKKSNGKFSLNCGNETPSFLSERIDIELEILKMSDGGINEPKHLYMSRGQLKKHTSTVVNFSLNIRYISQQVNMPLLRLLHQISNMYINVKEAQDELKDQPDTKRSLPIKDESSLASEMNDATLVGSIHEAPMDSVIFDYSDERYDKFNELGPTTAHAFPLGHSISRTKMPPLGPLIPLPSTSGARPQSFAQKLRSTGKTVKGKLGYTNLSESVTTPNKASPTIERSIQKINLEQKSSLPPTSGPLVNEAFVEMSQINFENVVETPKCWTTIFNLLDIYAAMPEMKTLSHRVSLSPDAIANLKSKLRSNHFFDAAADDEKNSAMQHVQTFEKTRLIVFGVVKINRTRLLATLSGLKLEAEITSFNSSTTWRNKTRPVSLECSLTGQIGRAMIVLLEGVAPNQQTVVKVTVGKSQTLYSSVSKKGKDKNNALLTIGAIFIDIPLHPIQLHGMVTRSSKQLSTTLQELRVTRTSARLSKQNEDLESPMHSRETKEKKTKEKSSKVLNRSSMNKQQGETRSGLLQPLLMQFNVFLQSLSITASLLPSLQAQYKMDNVTGKGSTGKKANFNIDLPSQSLSFITKASSQDSTANLPPQASIPLPQVHISAEFIPEDGTGSMKDTHIDGVILRQGGYLSAFAEIGEFERCLTTDLLNHLVFVQKVFMKEINEVVQKIYGGEKPVNPLWLEENEESHSNLRRVLFSLNIHVKRIQLTATTPCSSAVRFETGSIDFHLSNRVKNLADGSNTKLFGKAQIDLNLSLGQIIKNVIFDEAEPEFQQYAFFNTTIGFRNAFQNEMLNDDRELVLITLKRPLVYFQPIAIDKAILVWLNYKTAYEYWAEKRANLNMEVLTATQHVFDKVPFSASNLSTLFLQLTVEDMGICMPLNIPPLSNTWGARSIVQDFEQKKYAVITLENTIISACSSGSLVSKGKFVGLCFRFADDFDSSLDDWKPNINEDMMNLCVVSEGTYEVCSTTIASKKLHENAKWFLNVKWQMEGVDINLDVNIGKHLSALGHTLTQMQAGAEEDDDQVTLESPDSDSCSGKISQDILPRTKKTLDSLPSFLFDPTLDSKKRSQLMENEISEQTKIVSDLRSLGASVNTISHEERRLEELQALCYKYFRRDMIQKLKRPSALKRSMMLSSNRSKSFVAPSPTHEHIDFDAYDMIMPIDENSEITQQNSPSSHNSSSLRIKIPQRVQFSESLRRQTSLPSADSDADYSQEWPSMVSINEGVQTINIDGENVELRKKLPPVTSQKPHEPNIDFELDVKVVINSGKCVLHTKESSDEKSSNYSSNVKTHRRERSIGTDHGSPLPNRRNKEKSKLKYNTSAGALVDLTIFHIPGLDVKLHYQSKTLPDDMSPKVQSIDPFGMPINTTRRMSTKRASLFAWLTLQSIPEETIISPHILEFLEQTLEPLPTAQFTVPSSNPVNLEMLEHNYVVYASFPVDVIVYFHMKPSTFRFSCLPVSRVECMLQLPSLDIIFSSKRQEENASSDKESMKIQAIGGLSVTGCLADFNVYIFHPYGGSSKKATGTKESQPFPPLTDNERKDSLSINVEFVKFHLTRSRKLNFESNLPRKSIDQSSSRATIRFNSIVDIGTASFKYDMRRLTEILAFPKAWYRRNIMRRLFLGDLSVQQTNLNDDVTSHSPNEKSPLFLSKQKMKLNLESEMSKGGGVGMKSSKGKFSSPPDASSPCGDHQYSSWETLVLFAINFTKLNVQMNMGNVMGNCLWLSKAFRSDGSLSIGSSGHKNLFISLGLGGSTLESKGGIVGGTVEINTIHTHFHICEEPNYEPDHKIGIKFKALELKFDYMGTSVLMMRISDFNAALKDEWKRSNNYYTIPKRPVIILIHGDLNWDQFQIMISKSTTADILKMFYKLEDFFSQQFKSSKRVFTGLEPKLQTENSLRRKQLKKKIEAGAADENIQLSVDARHHRHWQKPLKHAMGLCISTIKNPLPKNGIVLGGTMELHGKNISLACFHGINFKSKSWALFSLREPCINFATEAQQQVEKSGDFHINQTLTFGLGLEPQSVPQHHSMATVVRMSRNVIFPPQFKTLQEWFHYAFSNSEIDAVDRFPVFEKDAREANTNSIERARGSGSVTTNVKLQDHNHNREVIFALPSLQLHFKTEHLQPSVADLKQEKPLVECSFITEFEDHIFVTVDADAFFFLHDLITSYLKEKEKVLISQNARSGSPNLINTAVSKESTNNLDVSSSNIGASSLSMASDNVSVSSNLAISSSNKNLTTLSGASSSSNANSSEDLRHMIGSKKVNSSKGGSDKDREKEKVDIETFLRMDWRNFNCKTWHLEPTIRLLSWAGQQIEPYGIDFILHKLGFSHARTTIPKWLQRGFMDPLDKLQSLLIMQLLLMVEENKQQEEKALEDKNNKK
ncbi:CLUMA_CG007483, isoform B [Clunio marinus]|uniref:CLUMA_CG007483, isoform B n=1 Tax=Clunio marinus TaxID=568069 RepID=A0A1J1I102_9DIPT|nr:CLUMA_CG007483, isoform B [Clunio marinus]